MVLPEGSQKMVASSDSAFFTDCRYVTDSGGRIGGGPFDLHTILEGKYNGHICSFENTSLPGEYAASGGDGVTDACHYGIRPPVYEGQNH
jgi:hypothetical protein